jgi:hypothetical protein
VFSDQQLTGLEKRFEVQRYLSTPERVELATELRLSETQVNNNFNLPTFFTSILYIIYSIKSIICRSKRGFKIVG